MYRRSLLVWSLPALVAGAALPHAASAARAADEFDGDPFRSYPWIDMRREYLAGGPVVYDPQVVVQAPAFAEDPMNVPVSVKVGAALGPIQQVVVLVDRNPIRRVLAFFPVHALPSVAFRFKLEQASPVRAAAQTSDGVWHVGGTWVDSGGGGCTVSGATRKDGSWSRTLGEVSGRLFPAAAGEPASGARLRLRVMHPMDTGLVGGVPAFFINHLSVRDGDDHELARLQTWQPVSENPVFSFDFARPPAGGVHVVGTDNDGNRIASHLE